MKKLLILLVPVSLGLAFLSCTKDEMHNPFVTIAGNFTNTPDPSAGFWDVPMPDGSYFSTPKEYKVDGTCDHLEEIDETRSVLKMSNVEFDPLFGGFKADVSINLVGSNGDELFTEGQAIIYQNLYNESFFHFNGGTGKFHKAEGWMNATGQMDPLTGFNIVTGAGEICEPSTKK